MQAFITAHATHPEAHMALALAAAQIEAQRTTRQPAFIATLGLVYLTDAYAPQAEALLAELRQRWPGVHWAGSVGVGVMASGVEYIDEPALVLMLCDLPVGSFPDVEAALRALPPEGDVLIAGSLYLAGEVLRLNRELPD